MEINKKNKEIFDAAIKDYMSTYCPEGLKRLADKYDWNEEDCESVKNTFSPKEKQLRENAFKFAIRELTYEAMKNKDYHIVYGSHIYDDAKLLDVVIPYNIRTAVFSEISVLTLGNINIPDKDVTIDECCMTYIELSKGSMDDDKIIDRVIQLD